MNSNLPIGVEEFVSQLREEIKTNRQYLIHGKTQNPAVLSEVSHANNLLWLTFTDGDIYQDLTIPIPQTNPQGNLIIQSTSCTRAVGCWMRMPEKTILSYWDLISWVMSKNTNGYFPSSSKKKMINRLLTSFIYNASALVFRKAQKLIDELINQLPLVGTPMQTWAMCNRIQILDPEFDAMVPKDKLNYQTKLNEDMFPFTSLGLSDSNMINNNLLTIDVKRTIPFGLSHHSPRRNLYQTLGMRGTETPKIMSLYEKSLADKGIIRTGYNLVTAFVDLPDNYEDQIIVSNRLRNEFIEETRTFVSHGLVVVHEGDSLFFLEPMAIEPDKTILKFDVFADAATIKSVEDIKVNFNGTKVKAKKITVTLKRILKDGFKLTNRHGNKGIIFTTDTGYMNDPVHGRVPIDVIVSAKSVMKRKNYGQIFEATASLVSDGDNLVISDDYVAHTDNVKESLIKKGYSTDGTVKISTQWGEFKAICGNVFWGIIKTPEDQLWTKHEVTAKNNKGIRGAGAKISHIELKALLTIFGSNNPVIKEILSHQQGIDSVFPLLDIVASLSKDTVKVSVPTIEWDIIHEVDQSNGIFHNPVDLGNTISDPNFYPEGFYLRLPENIRYLLTINEDGISEDIINLEDEGASTGSASIVIDKILMAPGYLRKPWKHSTGKMGLNDIASLSNNVIKALYRYTRQEEDLSRVGRNIFQYYHGISKILSTKTGLISQYCMSVRYPHTVKATAVVSSNLDKNEIEIHSSMANQLGVINGDFVIVERYPCLGFKSLRIQKIKVTEDPQTKYVIRVSGNSLASLTLDFDGDVIYLMSFKTAGARKALEKEFSNPHSSKLEEYEAASSKKVPEFKELTLDDYNIEIFPPLTAAKNAEIVNGLTGIKRGTGTTIALCYNLMRIIESNLGYSDIKVSVAMEVLLDKIANSVFSMKHAGKSLEEECRLAVCTADVKRMVALGFNYEASKILCDLIKRLAPKVGIQPNNLKKYYQWAEENNRASVINKIIRTKHKVWLASRSNLHPIDLLQHLSGDPVDLTAFMFKDTIRKYNTTLKTPKSLTA